MRYFLDTEFNEFGGELISLALVRQDGRELYLATECPDPGEWVRTNVIPILQCIGARPRRIAPDKFGRAIARFLAKDAQPVIVADWPDDIAYFCKALITGPGLMVRTQDLLTLQIVRVDSYPTDLPGAVQHNALWDARALEYACD